MSAREKCGIFGVYGHPDAAWLTYLGLHALQHRGQEGAGIVSAHEADLHTHRGQGLVSDVFTREAIEALPGRSAIGHNRYSTTGADKSMNLQPLVASYRDGRVAIAHNGNLVNARELREECEHLGSIFQTTVDSEVIVHLLARAHPPGLDGKLRQTLSRVRGAYSLVCLSPDALLAIRDPNGFRPLCLGRLDDAWIVASESCALDIIKAEYVREVEPGEIVVIEKGGVRSLRFGADAPRAECVFEHIYFARPDSRAYGSCVSEVRRALGRQLAREHPVDADLVMAVPDSSNAAALGYSRESKIPLEHGLIRNHYVGRTFISSSQEQRDFGVRLKYNAVREVLEGQRVVVVDDSVVRGTTSRSLMRMIREAGAREIHFRVSSPPVKHPCFYGIDMPTYSELVASERTVPEIRDAVGVDSLGYLSVEGMLRVIAAERGEGQCDACFTGAYPVRWKKIPHKEVLSVIDSGGVSKGARS
ncbi:MAG: amidophosphoribosyltransferase [Gemmatimonadota bacterium]|jgi:amidophosphoribosyltransferase|nr:amidophosphoribosyltransferase [Gemmatimonadota bacterium]MDP6461716.1 amidophosphoribosyltransferase [Gemmatimonadota bacterium]MDP6528145.1 amidophosphoribosyltransferase [Gemmatimonadota bacterium]MDP6801755.1 amidophosphoribosyltransferase [Gemmatimonadota bacterium]MDP7031169.1 amidophosphoribosyltransferase [Gemmatimonadota bacterium]